MSKSVLIDQAICLPAQEVEALIQGRTIVVLPRMFIDPGRQFALYPAKTSNLLLPLELYYNANIQKLVVNSLAHINSEIVRSKVWAKCELCQVIDDTEDLNILSQATIWTTEALKAILLQHHYIFLTYLRLYELIEPIEITNVAKRQFIPLPQPQIIVEPKPILSNNTFSKRKYQLENRQPPQYPELEKLQSSLANLTLNNPSAKKLDNEIQVFLGWSSNQLIKESNPGLAWISKIAALGNRSKEEDEGKSNYQAGTDFEIIVRQSLELLGFTVDYFHKGGAGGVDVFCSQPYPLIAECKAGKKIPNDTAVQLLNLGTLRLKSQELFKQATKLIIGPGEGTTQLQDAAKVQDMAIINPETLEKLVKLQSNYRNSIDLFKLREYLKAGQCDHEVEKYIEKVSKEISLRSHIVQLVKNYLQNSGIESAGVDSLHGAYFGSNPPQPLKTQEMHEILIELSSPLTGYLGREKGSDWRSDRFYYLRDLSL
ncbi:DUF1802 family protein [Calothrix sp. FACHB-156]|nr:DUF1802 family protein [Calothrix sp. FACHB-156]